MDVLNLPFMEKSVQKDVPFPLYIWKSGAMISRLLHSDQTNVAPMVS